MMDLTYSLILFTCKTACLCGLSSTNPLTLRFIKPLSIREAEVCVSFLAGKDGLQEVGDTPKTPTSPHTPKTSGRRTPISPATGRRTAKDLNSPPADALGSSPMPRHALPSESMALEE